MSYIKKDISICERSANLRPIELLKTRGSQNLSDYDLIALVIGNNKNLHFVCKTLSNMINCDTKLSIASICEATGLSEAKACCVLSALELGRRKAKSNRKSINGPESLYLNLLHWANEEREHFIVANINGAHELTELNVISIGLLNKTLVHPREVFRKAISQNSANIIIAHNHPSGSLYPSPEDIRITKRLVKAGDIIGIPVLDHIIFTSSGFFSFQQERIFPDIKDC